MAADEGLILRLGASGAFDSAQVSCPRVLHLGRRDWRMWYYGRDPDFNPLVRLPTGRIGLACSADGLHWRRVRGPGAHGCVLDISDEPGAFDSGHVGLGDVHAGHDGFEMWYFGGPSETRELAGLEVAGFPMRTGLARSPDGIRWTRVPGPHGRAWLDVGEAGEPDALMVGWPQVVRVAEHQWHLYYHSFDARLFKFLVCLAASADGRQWQKRGAIFGPGESGAFDEDGVATRHVIRWRDQWLMFYEGYRQQHASIGLATSVDKIEWRRVRGPAEGGAILARSPPDRGHWDAGAVGTPWVIQMADGGLRMYYVGAAQREDRIEAEAGAAHQIGLAVCAGEDLRRWQRWIPSGT